MKATTAGLAAVLMGSALGFAQPQGQPTQAQPAPKMAAPKAAAAKVSKYSGTIDAVYAALNKIEVKDAKGMAREFVLGSDVNISRGGKTLALADIKPGDRVTVSYEGSADSARVTSIHVAKAHHRG